MNYLDRINILLQKFKMELISPFNPFGKLFMRLYSSSAMYTLYTEQDFIFYQNTLKESFKFNSELSKTCSINNFDKKFRKLLVSLLEIDSKIEKEIFSSFINSFLSEPVKKFQVLKPIIGICLKKESIHELGIFKILDSSNEKHRSYVSFKSGGVNPIVFWPPNSPQFYIMIETQARDSETALDNAENVLRILESFLKFSLGRPLNSNEHLGIVDISFPITRTGIMISDESQVSSSFFNNSYSNAIPIDDEFFNSKESGNEYLWKLMNDYIINPNPFQRKLAQGIIWVGKAFSEKNSNIAILQYTMALESIFSGLEKGLITNTIVASISESMALIIGTNYQNRIEIIKNVREIYALRSAISHGNQKEISPDDLYRSYHLAVLLIRAFLVVPELYSLKSIDELKIYLDKIKYGV